MNKEKSDALLAILERGVSAVVTDKFAEVLFEHERDPELRGTEFCAIGRALGETLDSFEYPVEWERLLKRKDCPKYMREIRTICVNAYYPKLSLPQEEHWLTFDK